MRDGWLEARLGDVTTMVRRGKAPEYVDEDGVLVLNQKCIRPGNVIDLRPARQTNIEVRAVPSELFLRDNDVVVCSTGRGTLGRAAGIRTSEAPMTVDGHVTIVRSEESRLLGTYAALVLSSRFENLVALGSGSTNQTELSPSSIASLPIALPPLEDQRRIVDLVRALDDTVATASASSVRSAYDGLLAHWMTRPGVPLSRALTQMTVSAPVEPAGIYRIVGVLRSGGGFIDRGEVLGRETSYGSMFRVDADQLVYRKLTAWEGPISVSTAKEAGGWVSSEFPIFDVNPDVLRPTLLRHYCRWPGLWHRIGQRLVGSVQRRKRLNPSDLLKIEVPMPTLARQDVMVEALDVMWKVVLEWESTSQRLRHLRDHLLTALLSGEHEIPDAYDDYMGAAT